MKPVIKVLALATILFVLYDGLMTPFLKRSEPRGSFIPSAETEIAIFRTGLQMFEIECGRFPTTGEGLDALITCPANISSNNWHPYLDMAKIPLDPWHRPYLYKCPGAHNPAGYDVFSMGPNNRLGEEIGNWSK